MKIKYILIFVLCFFCLNVNVFATSFDFTCEYKNGNEILKLIMSSDYDNGVSASYALIINDASSIKFYPANFITYSDNSYQTLDGAAYVSGKYYTNACPKKLDVAVNNGTFIYKNVRYSYDLIMGEYLTSSTPIIFFSEYGYKIDNGIITSEVVSLDDPITNNVLKSDNYTIKTFSLNSENSENNVSVVPPSESETNQLQYCYYENSCGEIIELKFYKNANINQRVFSDGKKLMNWNNSNICPTSVKKNNEDSSGYYGYSFSCSSSGSVKLCYDFLESSSNKKNIITEGNCSGLSDNSNDIISNATDDEEVIDRGSQKESDSEYTLDNATDFDVENSCCELQPFLKILKIVISILQFSIPLLLIVLGTFDMFKAVTSGDEKVISDVRLSFIKRVVYGVIIFLVPFLVSLILNLVNDALISDDGLVKSTTWIDCWQGNISCSNKS